MKKGFVFMETLIVLVVLAVTIVSLYGMYVKVSSDIESRKYYDNISDLYKTDIIRKLIKENMNLPTNTSLITIDSENCDTYMQIQCKEIIPKLNAQKVFITNTNLNAILKNSSLNVKNSMLEYLKTVNSIEDNSYIIVNFYYNNNNYYASLKV